MIVLGIFIWLIYLIFAGRRMYLYLDGKIPGFQAFRDCFEGLLICLCVGAFVLWFSVT